MTLPTYSAAASPSISIVLAPGSRTGLLRSFGQLGGCFAPRRRSPQGLRNGQSRADPVLVESISGPGATEPGVTLSLNLHKPFLRGKGGRVILGMFADKLAEGELRVGLERGIEADKQRLVPVDTLKLVHPVGNGNVVDSASLTGPAQKVPSRPDPPPAGHQPGIPVKVNHVGRIADGAQHRSLPLVGIGKHLERLVAVG